VRLDTAWSWVREPDPTTYGVRAGTFHLDTDAGDLYVDSNTAPVLTREAPRGNYLVETRVRLDVPPQGCCQNFVQAGMVVHGGDDAFVKLAHASLWKTGRPSSPRRCRPHPLGSPLRQLGRRAAGGLDAPPDRQANPSRRGALHRLTSQDARRWVRGGNWTHDLGRDSRIGLVSMGGAGFQADFDYVRVLRVR
jgi:arabinan endo-1,5-alpha-L-arabinosidase